MLTIRLARVGKKNKAQFKIVLQEHTVAPGGRHVEILGSYDPHSKVAVIKEDRVKYWVGQGAQPSDTAYNLLLGKGIISGKKREVKIPAKIANKEGAEGEVKKETGGEKPVETPSAEEKKEESKTEEAPKEAVKTEEKKESPKTEEAPKEEIKEEAKKE